MCIVVLYDYPGIKAVKKFLKHRYIFLFVGLQCEVNEDDCAPKPGSWEPRCLNGGQCVDGVGHYTCTCPPGFTGQQCEGDVNECLSRPCHAPGSLDCVQMVNDYQCRCRLGYTGTYIFVYQKQFLHIHSGLFLKDQFWTLCRVVNKCIHDTAGEGQVDMRSH